MKLVLVLLALLCLSSITAQTIYNPGMNVDVKDLLIFKIKDVIVPEIMEEFKQIQIPDQGVTHDSYELRVYGLEADIVPLTKDQIQIITDEPQNALTVTVNNFQMSFEGNAYARALFIHLHGSATIQALLRTVSFTVVPKLRVDGDLNAIDYDIKDIKIDVHAGDIKFSKLTIGDLPSWLLASITNVFIESATFIYHEFEGFLDGLIVKALDKWRVAIPDAIEIPDTQFSVSVSFPNVPHFKADRIELPFDGTIFLTSEGYHPSATEISPIPSFNPEDPNNIQVFLHEHVLNTAIAAIKKSNAVLTVNEEMLTRFQLPTNILLVKWFSHLFPKLLCSYDKDATMSIDLGVDPNLETSLHFTESKIHGEFSPMFKFNVIDNLAFTLSFRAVIDVDLQFSTEDKTSVVHGLLNTLDIADINFVAGGIPSSDLPDIINKFKPIATSMIITTVNNMLITGVTIPVIQAIKAAFEVDIEDINLGINNQYAGASLTVDVSQLDKILAGLKKLGYNMN